VFSIWWPARAADARFSSADCEFLRQLCSNVGGSRGTGKLKLFTALCGQPTTICAILNKVSWTRSD